MLTPGSFRHVLTELSSIKPNAGSKLFSASRLIDILIAIFTGFLVSMVTHYVEKFFSEKKRSSLGKQFLPISNLKIQAEKVANIFLFIVNFSQTDHPHEGILSLPTNEELFENLKEWDLDGPIPEMLGTENQIFNAKFRYTEREPTFGDGLCNEIQKFILTLDDFVFSTTFAYVNLKEQSVFMNFLANEFTMQFKREIQGDTGLKGAYDPSYILTSESCAFGTWISSFFNVIAILNKYIVNEGDLVPVTK